MTGRCLVGEIPYVQLKVFSVRLLASLTGPHNPACPRPAPRSGRKLRAVADTTFGG